MAPSAQMAYQWGLAQSTAFLIGPASTLQPMAPLRTTGWLKCLRQELPRHSAVPGRHCNLLALARRQKSHLEVSFKREGKLQMAAFRSVMQDASLQVALLFFKSHGNSILQSLPQYPG